MILRPVTSSNIAAIGHDPAGPTLHVKFKDGTQYRYDGVTANQHQAMLLSPSVGSHFHKHIKDKFKSTKV